MRAAADAWSDRAPEVKPPAADAAVIADGAATADTAAFAVTFADAGAEKFLHRSRGCPLPAPRRTSAIPPGGTRCRIAGPPPRRCGYSAD